MSKIQVADVASDPATPPPAGQHFLYTKAAGLFSMDEFGVVTGPFTGGSGPPTGPAGGSLSGTYPNPGIAAGAVGTTELAPLAVTTGKIALLAVGTGELQDASVTTLKIANGAVQTAQLANSAVVGAKIAGGSVDPTKLANPSGIYKVPYADSPVSWTFGYLPRVRFGIDPAGPYSARISVLGDLGGVNDPRNPRVLDHTLADLPLGYLVRVLSYEVKVAEVLSSLADTPTSFNVTASVPITISLPDSRKYPPGTEIQFVHIGGTNGTATILKTGPVAGGYSDIQGSPPAFSASDGILVSGETKSFVTFGNGWYVSRESFTKTQVIPVLEGYSEFDSTGNAYWRPNPASSTPWEYIGTAPANRFLMFPVDLPDRAILTGVDVMLAMSGIIPVPASRTKVYLIRNDFDFTLPSYGTTTVASATAAGALGPQVVSLSALTESIVKAGKSWTVAIESSNNVAPLNGDAVYAVRLTYTLP